MNSFGGLFDSLKQLIVDSVVNVITNPETSVAGITDPLTQTAGGFSAESYQMVANIAKTVILPIAGVILTYVAVQELITMTTDRNNMHERDSWDIFLWIFKTSIAVLLVSNAFLITDEIIKAGTYIVLQATPVINNPSPAETTQNIADALMELDMFSVAFVGIAFWASMVVYLVLKAIVILIIITRFVEIYMYMSVSPIPYSTFTSRELSGVGINYIKNIISLALQGIIIMISVSIFSALRVTFAVKVVNPGDSSASLIWIAIQSLLLIGALTLSVIKSRKIAQSIVDAH
ncbi:VirB6/TrbL-like conjugal transfer protein, CD1112 family [Aerococcus tenax]|nr:CD0415/CD1112 family protein [Aerococcus urinae]RAV69962.1 hypothetical protein DBT40_08690 [Aerococcus urinae]